MKNGTSFAEIFLFIGLAGFFLLPSELSLSHPVGSNGWHLNSPLQAESNADLVCKVRVFSLRRDKTFGSGSVSPDLSKQQ